VRPARRIGRFTGIATQRQVPEAALSYFIYPFVKRPLTDGVEPQTRDFPLFADDPSLDMVRLYLIPSEMAAAVLAKDGHHEVSVAIRDLKVGDVIMPLTVDT
jgi:hypothetical protein